MNLERTFNSSTRVAVVTGANRGIGFEIARQLAGRGVHVILTSRDETKGRLALQRLADDGLSPGYHQLDVIDHDGIRRLRDFLDREHGRVDILVNNAGIAIDDGTSALKTQLDTVRRTMETNLYGPLLLSQMLVPLMRRIGYGRIVNVSSGMGQISSMRSGALSYRLSKAALNALTRILAAELKRSHILVNSMCPGHVRTAMGGSSASRSVEEGADTAIWLATLPDDGPTGGFFRDRQPIPW